MKTLKTFAAGLLMLTTTSPLFAVPPGLAATPGIDFKPPRGERFTLENGLVVYLMKDNTLPVVHISAMVKLGAIQDPPLKIGLGNLTVGMLKNGGTKNYTAEAIDEELEFRGASISGGIYREETRLTMTTLKKDLTKVLDIFAEELRAPVFNEEKLRLAKDEQLELIRRRNDKPTGQLFRESLRKYFGENHPYGWRSEAATISAVTREDLLAHHATYFKPNNTILAVSGDFASAQEMLALLTEKFGAWEKGMVPPPSLRPFEHPKGRKIYFIDKDLSQAFIIILQKGLPNNSPDEYPMTLLSEVLGGGIQSRLMVEVRSKRGLAYTVESNIIRYSTQGLTYTYCGTKPETYSQALTEVLAQLDRAVQEPLSAEELKRGKSSIINPFVFKFPTPFQLISDRASEEFYGLQGDYLDNYVSRIEKLSQDDLLAAAKKYYATGDAVIFVIGNSKKFDKPLAEFGPVTELKED